MEQMFKTKMNASQKEEIDNLSKSLNRQLLSAHDCYRPFTSNSLINTMKRYITTTLKFEAKSWNFIHEIRSKLYLIHEYNLEIFKLTHRYPKIRNFDLLLAKYIELEYEILYRHSGNIDRNIERRVGQRILRLLYIIFQHNLNNDELLTKASDVNTKKTILKLFVDIKFEYFSEGRFIFNIASQLIGEIDDANRNISTCHSLFHYLKQKFSTSKNSTTSDYGSDDSDCDEINYCTNTQTPTTINCTVNVRNTKEVEEVPVTKNGVQPVVTFEFINNDSDYMVYLSGKNDNHLSKTNKNCDQIRAINSNNNNEIVMLSSDDENDSPHTATKQNKRKKKKKLKHKQQQEKSVVTFEIMNDDDDTNSYMVYLQKEVETNSKRKKLILEEPDVVLLSDSDNDGDDTVKAPEIKNEPTPMKIEPSIGEQKNQLQTTEMKNEANTDMKIETNELDLKVDIVIEETENQGTDVESFRDNDPCMNGDLIDPSSIFQNIPSLSNFDLNPSIDEFRLNDSLLEEILETSHLSKKDFEDLECFLFDTTEKNSFSQYCEQYSDIDDISHISGGSFF